MKASYTISAATSLKSQIAYTLLSLHGGTSCTSTLCPSVFLQLHIASSVAWSHATFHLDPFSTVQSTRQLFLSHTILKGAALTVNMFDSAAGAGKCFSLHSDHTAQEGAVQASYRLHLASSLGVANDFQRSALPSRTALLLALQTGSTHVLN